MRTNMLAGGTLEVSALCLGSMLWGTMNTEAEGHTQIDMSLDHGINFIDTAEMYPVNPIKAEACGATKVAGDNPGFVRDGRGYDGAVIHEAVDASLSRLRTDYIDLYQLHWPMRGSYAFRQNWTFDASGQNREQTEAHMRDVLSAMKDVVRAKWARLR